MSAAITTEETMRLLTYLELSRYTKPELHALLQQLLRALPHLRVGSRAHANAVMNIRHVRLFLARRDYRQKMRL